eukprot:8746661-Alexandrium_andersonii.AAC.2
MSDGPTMPEFAQAFAIALDYHGVLVHSGSRARWCALPSVTALIRAAKLVLARLAQDGPET